MVIKIVISGLLEHLSAVDACPDARVRLGKAPVFAQQHEQLSAVDEVHHLHGLVQGLNWGLRLKKSITYTRAPPPLI